MSTFKVGDTVILENYGRVRGRPFEEGNEYEDWALSDGLPLNTPLEVVYLSERGWLNFKGYSYYHHPYKFKLKSETVSKQLTGYKLKKAIPGDVRTVGTVVPMTTEESYYSLMPDFWEPQYKEESFKEGDYVYVIPGMRPSKHDTQMTYALYNDYSGKIYKLCSNSRYKGLVHIGCPGGYYLPQQVVRKATPEEIEKLKAVVVAGYESKYGKGVVSFGCKDFSKVEIAALIKFMSINEAAGKFSLAGSDVTLDMLNKIYSNI